MHAPAAVLMAVGELTPSESTSLPWLWIGIGLLVVSIGAVVLFLLRAGRELDTEIRLVVTKGLQSGTALRIGSSYATIGSEGDNDITVGDDKVSRHHARFRYRRGNLTVSDSNSLYGTFLNGERVNEAVCADGDMLRLGTQFECRIELKPR